MLPFRLQLREMGALSAPVSQSWDEEPITPWQDQVGKGPQTPGCQNRW